MSVLLVTQRFWAILLNLDLGCAQKAAGVMPWDLACAVKAPFFNLPIQFLAIVYLTSKI
jgi:hypothetical protein